LKYVYDHFSVTTTTKLNDKMCTLSTALYTLILSAITLCPIAHAESDVSSSLRKWLKDRIEISGGNDAARGHASAYTSVVFGINNRLNEEGWRIFLHTDVSIFQYTAIKNYRQRDPDTGLAKPTYYDQFSSAFRGIKTEGDALAGYQLLWNHTWLKLYAGGTYQAQNITQLAAFRMDGQAFSPADYIIPAGDPAAASTGIHWGGKVAGEMWMPLSANLWTSTGVSVSTINRGYSASTRLAYKLPSWLTTKAALTLGPEASAAGDADYTTLRAGAFAQIGVLDTEITLSGGSSCGGVTGHSGDLSGGYAALGVYRRF
jgi:hypothetical protein